MPESPTPLADAFLALVEGQAGRYGDAGAARLAVQCAAIDAPIHVDEREALERVLRRVFEAHA